MAKLILASVVCIFLLVKGTEAQAVGADCTGTNTCDEDTATCDTTCKIKVGETCTSASSTDCIAHATCDADSLECTCGADYTPKGDSTQCEAKVGTSCVDSTPCVSGSSCDTTCKVNAGQSCADGLTCVTTATCEGDTTCKIKVGETCTSASSTDCIAHATCDGDPLQCTCADDYTPNGDSTQCEAKVGTSCVDSTPCVSGSSCDTTCKVNAGQSCADGLTCVTTATCEGDTTCKIKVGETCTSGSTNCIAHATCDADSLECTCGADYTPNGDSTQCEAKVGTSCVDSTPCVSGSSCDTTCKVNAGQSCADGLTCVTTATCEGDTMCKIKVGETCTSASSTDCIAHATCDGDPLQCTCADDYTPNGDSTQCEAKVGTSCVDSTPCVSGSSCDTTCKINAGTDGCTTTGTTLCVSTATCESGTCVAKAGETCSASIDCVTGATCEGGTCKINAGTDGCTTTGTTLCVSTATCESGTCVANLGESCRNSISCVTDTECDDTDSICRTKVTTAGNACSEKTTFCDPTTLTCDGEKCKIQADQNCAAATTQCTAHAECDTTCNCIATDYKADSGVCVGIKVLGDECANDNCDPELVCDAGYCKTKLEDAGNDCSASVTDKACDPTTLACQDGKCKWKIEQDCTATDTCVAGAKCEGSGTTKQCSCPANVKPSSDKAQCGGAMGVAASMLLVVATFVTSRFF